MRYINNKRYRKVRRRDRNGVMRTLYIKKATFGALPGPKKKAKVKVISIESMQTIKKKSKRKVNVDELSKELGQLEVNNSLNALNDIMDELELK